MTHMAWCKQRAMIYLNAGDTTNAIASFASDIRKDVSTNTPAVTMLVATVGLPLAASGDVAELRNFIDGFAE